MRETFSYYEFEVKPHEDMWVYDIYHPEHKNEVLRESEEWYDTEQEARLAAIGHISLLENGEG